MPDFPVNPPNSNSPVPPFGPQGIPPSASQDSSAYTGDPVVVSGIELVDTMIDISQRTGSKPLQPLQADVLAQAVLNFSNVYKSASNPPSWATQLNSDINQGNPSLYTLASQGNIQGIIDFYAANSSAFSVKGEAGTINGEIQAELRSSPVNLNPTIPASPAVILAAQNLFGGEFGRSPQDTANDIITLTEGLQAMNPKDPNEQILYWTLTAPTNPSDPNSSLYGVAKSGNTANLENLINTMGFNTFPAPPAGSQGDWCNFILQNFLAEQGG